MADHMGENWLEEWERLNMRAQLALGLAMPDILGPIVELLRSEAPIHPIVRASLADAFEGKRPSGAPIFVVRDIGRSDYSGKSLSKFRRDVQIARFIAAYRLEHPKKSAVALRAAADKFIKSEKHCEAARTKVAKMDAWLLTNFAEAERIGAFAQLSDDRWQEMREAHYWARFLYKSSH